MREGDRVCLKQPFQPNPALDVVYRFGIVAAVVVDEATDRVTEVLVQLYDPANDSVYLDEFGANVLHSFLRDEVEPM